MNLRSLVLAAAYTLLCNSLVVVVEAGQSNEAATSLEWTTSTTSINSWNELSSSRNHTSSVSERWNASTRLLTKCERGTANACLNGGECSPPPPPAITTTTDEQRESYCLCKGLFHGDHCQFAHITKECNKQSMELVIYHDLAVKFKSKMVNLYVNENNKSFYCRLKPLNATHSLFQIPFEKCSTLQSGSKFEKIYTNRLFIGKHFLGKFDCVFRKAPFASIRKPMMSSSSSSSSMSNNNASNSLVSGSSWQQQQQQKQQQQQSDVIVEVAGGGANREAKLVPTIKPYCLLDLLNIKIRLFQDQHYLREIMPERDSFQLTRSKINFYQTIFVDFTVTYSSRFNQFAQLKDKLQFFQLTIEKCWLTKTAREDSNILEVLIYNGCPSENVHFYQTASNSIRFSFEFSKLAKHTRSLFIHCYPKVCTDLESMLITSHHYDSCQNISKECSDSNQQQQQHKNATTSNLNMRKIMKTLARPSGECDLKLSKGPVSIHNRYYTFNSPSDTERKQLALIEADAGSSLASTTTSGSSSSENITHHATKKFLYTYLFSYSLFMTLFFCIRVF